MSRKERRVAVTGFGMISALGSNWETFERNLRDNKSGVCYMPEWERYEGLNTRLAGPVNDFKLPAHYNRKVTRSMGRVAQLATYATELALIDAKLLNDPEIKSGAMGVAYGSCTGSTDAILEFSSMISTG